MAQNFEEILHPVEFYRDELRARHHEHTVAAFDEFFRRSGVDADANAKLVAQIRKLEEKVAHLGARRRRWSLLRWLCILLGLAGWGALAGFFLSGPRWPLPVPIAGAAAGVLFPVLIFAWINPRIKVLDRNIAREEALLKEKTDEAWKQMEPLNRLYQWDTIAKLVMKTLPVVAVDSYFSGIRLEQLTGHFGWSGTVGENMSVLACQSGALNGNPWCIGEALQQVWKPETYTGTLNISWQERETYTDSNGKTQSRWVTRHQTLTATVTKPKPDYLNRKYLIYGNEAAPDLTFSREPNPVSEVSGSFLGRRKLKNAVQALEKKSRNLKDGFVIMDNREFDACFNAVDRDHQVQFRMLYTPLAQQETLKLLRDREVGYGDDFSFRKDHMINILESSHLNRTEISAAPELFRTYDLSEAGRRFTEFSDEFFRSFYFSVAPLLCIPLYQEYRSTLDVYKGVIDTGEPAFYEYEALANALNDGVFAPAGAATQSILKTEVSSSEDEAASVAVTAHAFRGEERVEYVPKYGGDGKWHDVPVHWIEYLPVSRQRTMTVCRTGIHDTGDFAEAARREEWKEFAARHNIPKHGVCFRRSLAAFVAKS